MQNIYVSGDKKIVNNVICLPMKHVGVLMNLFLKLV